MIYTVTFNPAIDYVVHLQGELKQEGINRNTAEEYQFGGKGINVSNVLRTLGVESEALGFVAGFTGEGLEKGLQASGLHTDFIHVAEGMTRINVKIKAEQEAEINGIGPNITQEDMKQLYQKLDQIQAGDTLVLSGSIPSCLASDTYEKIMAHLADKDIRIVVDATRDLLVNVLKYHPFLIKPNNHELGEIFGVELKTRSAVVPYAKKLQEMGARNVLISMAGEGAVLVAEDGSFYETHAPKGTLVNGVGAGDSMVAGFLAGWLETGDYSHAFKMGVAAGSASAFSELLATKAEIEQLYATL